jgi:hypothetical protein
MMTQDLVFLNQAWVGLWIVKAVRKSKLEKRRKSGG